jgi:carbon-monoxide dehydrogenase large subunit
MGPQEMTAHIVRNGDTFTGRVDSPMGSESIADGKISGNTLAWTMDVKKPAAIKLEFEAMIDGSAMSGKAKLGMFGSADLTGRRV